MSEHVPHDEHGPVVTTDGERGAPAATCPVMHDPHHARGSTANQHWWPEQLNLRPLVRNSPLLDPMHDDFDYGAGFETLDLAEVKADIEEVMTTSRDWWPADYGHYGPLFIRMAWHSAGTYRIHDGRGGAATGTQRFAPLNSWPDNANLDKARRLLWPVKQKYGRRLSWADLLILAGNVALESMGLRTFGFGGGREDVWEPEEDVHWGPEDTWLADRRHDTDGRLLPPFGADQMGLIYVNPEGPNGVPDPVEAARFIRTTFANMAMDDRETVALIAGGHTFGKAHGAAEADRYVGPEPEAAPLEAQGLGWHNTFGTGCGADTITSGLEGAWTAHPTRWDNEFLEHLFGYEWELTRSPAGAYQWRPTDRAADDTVPDAHDPTRRHAPIMLTTDLALRFDPVYEPIARRFLEHPDELADAFARAWFKLTHRDMGPIARYRGPEVPAEPLVWQDPVPPVEHPLVGGTEVAQLKRAVLGSGLRIPQLVRVAWASASTYRDSDKRGGANGARIRLAPQRDWPVNDPAELAEVLGVLERIRDAFNDSAADGVRISLADLIVLAGGAAVEAAARAGGVDVVVPFRPGRTDAAQEWTDVASFAVLEPTADGFRNWWRPGDKRRQEQLLVERAAQLTLTPPELTVLIGGLRALGATAGDRPHGVLTDRPGVLTNDVLVNLLSMDVEWRASGEEHVYEGLDRRTGRRRRTATAVDLVFGSNSQLRALAEVYASADAVETFTADFVAVWVKVMELDRFDLRRE